MARAPNSVQARPLLPRSAGDLLQAAGLPFDQNADLLTKSAADLQRSYDFVIADPDLNQFRKPAGIPSLDFQKFLVQMHEHYTGKKLL